MCVFIFPFTLTKFTELYAKAAPHFLWEELRDWGVQVEPCVGAEFPQQTNNLCGIDGIFIWVVLETLRRFPSVW